MLSLDFPLAFFLISMDLHEVIKVYNQLQLLYGMLETNGVWNPNTVSFEGLEETNNLGAIQDLANTNPNEQAAPPAVWKENQQA